MSGHLQYYKLFVAILEQNETVVTDTLRDYRDNIDIDFIDDNSKTLLIKATEVGNVTIVQALLNAGATVDLVPDSTRSTPLLCAVLGGHTECVRALLIAKADREATVLTNGTEVPILAYANPALPVDPEIQRLLSTNYNELLKQSVALSAPAMVFRGEGVGAGAVSGLDDERAPGA